MEPGDTFRIEVVFREICASGQTVVPNIPKITKVSADTFFLHKRSSKQRDKEFMIEWSGVTDGNNFYFAKMDYIYGEPGDILSHQPLKIVPFYISSPQQQNQSKWLFNEYSFRDKNIFLINKDSYLSKIREGWYCFYINQVTQDFIDLYETKFNYWGEPDKIYSNIVNGFGIFTAFGVDSTFFYTKQIY